MINKEILSLELERIDLLGKISSIEQYLDYAEGKAYADDMTKLYEYKHRVCLIEEKLLEVRDNINVEHCKVAEQKLYLILKNLEDLHKAGYIEETTIDSLTSLLSESIMKTRDMYKYV